MTKADICKVLIAHPNYQGEDQQSAIAEFVVRNVKTAIVKEQPEDATITA